MEELAPASPKLVRHPFMRRVWRGAAWVLAPIAYLGLVITPTVVSSVPFQIFHRREVSPLVFWLTAASVAVLAFWLLYRLGRVAYRSLRQRVIDLEAVVGFIGLVLAIVVIAWIHPPK